jgi:hypothetical protein
MKHSPRARSPTRRAPPEGITAAMEVTRGSGPLVTPLPEKILNGFVLYIVLPISALSVQNEIRVFTKTNNQISNLWNYQNKQKKQKGSIIETGKKGTRKR